MKLSETAFLEEENEDEEGDFESFFILQGFSFRASDVCFGDGTSSGDCVLDGDAVPPQLSFNGKSYFNGPFHTFIFKSFESLNLGPPAKQIDCGITL